MLRLQLMELNSDIIKCLKARHLLHVLVRGEVEGVAVAIDPEDLAQVLDGQFDILVSKQSKYRHLAPWLK